MQERMQLCVFGEADPLSRVASLKTQPLIAIAVLAVLSGCGTLASPGAVPPAAVAAPPPRPADPLAAFAARAQPGQVEDIAATPGAAPVTVRMVRGYFSGSGRQCRELSVGYRAAMPALYCEDPATGWSAARALLRGGAVARP